MALGLRLFVVALCSCALGLLAVERVEACSCMRQEPAEAVEEAASVFEGRVQSIVAENGGFRVVLGVVRRWKGADAETVEVRTAGDSAQCGFPFEEGKSYLVYSRLAEEGGVEPVGLCSRTSLVENAHEDLAFLGAGVTPVNPSVGVGAQPAVRPQVQAQPTQGPGGSQSSPSPRSAGCQSCAATGLDPREVAGSGLLVLLVLGLGRRRWA